jgi:hypothetical protein
MAYRAFARHSGGVALGRHRPRYPATSPRIEGGPHGISVLAVEQVEDHRFQIGRLDVGFSPNSATRAEVIDHEIDVQIAALSTIDGVQPVMQFPRKRNTGEFKHETGTGIVPALLIAWHSVNRDGWQYCQDIAHVHDRGELCP